MYNHINDSSIPVLYRHGLVVFVSNEKKEDGKYYSVVVTPKGMKLAYELEPKI